MLHVSITIFIVAHVYSSTLFTKPCSVFSTFYRYNNEYAHVNKSNVNSLYMYKCACTCCTCIISLHLFVVHVCTITIMIPRYSKTEELRHVHVTQISPHTHVHVHVHILHTNHAKVGKMQHTCTCTWCTTMYLHFSLPWSSPNFPCGDQLLPRPHPQDWAVVAMATVAQLEVGQLSPWQHHFQKWTLFQEIWNN